MTSRFLLSAMFCAVALLVTVPRAADAQSIAAVVNGLPITSSEVSERRAFIRLTRKQNVDGRTALDQLIDENLIIEDAKKRGIVISDSDVDARFGQVASNVKLSPSKLTQALAQSGASARTFKQNIRSGLAGRRLIVARMKAMNTISEKDIATQMLQRKQEGETSYRYTLRQIIFVLPQDAPAGEVARRKREADGFRNRIQSCDQAVSFAKGLRDVAVKEPVTRVSGQLGKDMRENLDRLKVGQALPAERVDHGIEVITLCDKKATNDDTVLRQEIQNELASEQMDDETKKYVAELRMRAVIQYR